MKKLILLASFFTFFATGCNEEKKSVTADRSKADSTATDKPVDSVALMKAWEDYMKPGKSHTLLAKWVGKWNVDMTFYHKGQESKAKSTAEYNLKLGGRYLQCNYKGTIEGTPFEGENTTAFDNARKLFLSTWIDNMGTGIMYLEGTYNAATKTITSNGKATDVVTGKEFSIRETHTMIDDDNQVMEMFDIKNVEETKTMSLKLTRVKYN